MNRRFGEQILSPPISHNNLCNIMAKCSYHVYHIYEKTLITNY